MSARCTVATSVPRGFAYRPAPSSRCVSMRAEESHQSTGTPQQANDTVFYGGNTYTDAEFKAAKETGSFKPAPVDTGASAPTEEVATIGSLMAFDGPAPELINGRLAMVGFLAAVGAELASGQGVLMQFNTAPGPILVTFTLVAAATFIPLLQGSRPKDRSSGPFTAAAEMINGRAAMIGLTSLLISEVFTSGRAIL